VKTGAGVLVDEYLRTNVSNIYAAGDCAEVYDVNRRESRINFGWRSAMKQGELAGENMAGGGRSTSRTPRTTSGCCSGRRCWSAWGLALRFINTITNPKSDPGRRCASETHPSAAPPGGGLRSWLAVR